MSSNSFDLILSRNNENNANNYNNDLTSEHSQFFSSLPEQINRLSWQDNPAHTFRQQKRLIQTELGKAKRKLDIEFQQSLEYADQIPNGVFKIHAQYQEQAMALEQEATLQVAGIEKKWNAWGLSAIEELIGLIKKGEDDGEAKELANVVEGMSLGGGEGVRSKWDEALKAAAAIEGSGADKFASVQFSLRPRNKA